MNSAKVPMEAAMPDRRIMARPEMNAAMAATRPPITVASNQWCELASRYPGSPGMKMSFVIGSMVCHAVA